MFKKWLFMLLILLSTASYATNIYDPKVFNWRFYLDANPDLMAKGLLTEADAQTHWSVNGINEGRQAVASFHSKQYLDKYADVAAAYGSKNYAAAISHYLQYGYNEGRIGYFQQGGNTPGQANTIVTYGQLTISNRSGPETANTFYVSASEIVAGAIDSIYWNNKEFINSHDHGRQLQYAWQYGTSFNNSTYAFTTQYGECFNPTEAGSAADSTGWATSSILNSYSYNSTSFTTNDNPAYWIAPNSPCGVPLPYTSPTSGDTLIKNVSIASGPYKLIRLNTTVTSGPGKLGPTAYEAPTIYIASDLNEMHSFDPSSGALDPIAISTTQNPTCNNPAGNTLWPNLKGCVIDWPVIATTSDRTYAIGLVAIPNNSNNTYKYGFFYVDSQTMPINAESSAKLSAYVYSPWTGTQQFLTYVAVGTFTDVQQALMHAYQQHP